MTTDEFLAHHGVKGMKWGVITSIYNKSGIGKTRAQHAIDRYGKLATQASNYYGQVRKNLSKNSSEIKRHNMDKTNVARKAKKEKGKKWLIGIGLSLAVAGVGYAAYRQNVKNKAFRALVKENLMNGNKTNVADAVRNAKFGSKNYKVAKYNLKNLMNANNPYTISGKEFIRNQIMV